jgi:hypothetical protein
MTPFARTRQALACLAATASIVLASPTAHAATICRWVDEHGRTHLSDVVPAAFKKSAICTDSTQYEPTPEQRREAEQRAASERARSRAEASPPAEGPASSPPPAERAASRPAAKRPAESVTDATDCATWWRLYDESAECFGPYRNVRGGIKPEAFEQCNVIPSPEAKCGPRVR